MANTPTRIIKWACGNAVVAARIFAVNGRPEAEGAAGAVEAGTLATSAKAHFARAYGTRSLNLQSAHLTTTSSRQIKQWRAYDTGSCRQPEAFDPWDSGRRVHFRGTLHLFASCRSRSGLSGRCAACQNRVALLKLA